MVRSRRSYGSRRQLIVIVGNEDTIVVGVVKNNAQNHTAEKK